MKKYNWIWIIGICLLALTGCHTAQEEKQAGKDIPMKQIEQPEEEKNPFDLSEIEKSGQIIQASYGWTVAPFRF